jgi:hypothetical protein
LTRLGLRLKWNERPPKGVKATAAQTSDEDAVQAAGKGAVCFENTDFLSKEEMAVIHVAGAQHRTHQDL